MISIVAAIGLACAATPDVAKAGGQGLDDTAGARSRSSAYLELYRRIVDSRPAGRRYALAESVYLGEAAARLWLRTGEATYRAQAVSHFEAAMADPEFSLSDFHVFQGFGRLTLLLKRAGLLRPDCDEKLRAIAREQLKSFCDSADNVDHNIRLGMVLGCACLLAYLDGEPAAECDRARKRLEEYWLPIRRTGDLDEDASNYDSLGAAFLVDLVEVMGRREAMRRSAEFRRMFDRFRDVVSPSGLVPEYGDSYFSYSSCPLDRVFVLEYAARLYDDPTFLHAVRRLWARRGADLPRVDNWYRAVPLIDLPLLDAPQRAPQGPPSLVTRRARRGAEGDLVDKLILRTGIEPGGAMVLMDLYASGSHAHMEKGPSIAYYEADGVPLFHNLGRHRTRSAIAGNVLWARPPGEAFPGFWNRPGAWFTMAIPVEYLTREAGGHVVSPVLLLRNFQDRRCGHLWFDNLRLEGPAGEWLVDDFEDTARWQPALARTTEVVRSEDRTRGSFSQRAAWAAVPSAHFGRNLPRRPDRPFTTDRYRHLKLDVKHTGSRPYAHIRGLGRQVDLGDQCLVSEVRFSQLCSRR